MSVLFQKSDFARPFVIELPKEGGNWMTNYGAWMEEADPSEVLPLRSEQTVEFLKEKSYLKQTPLDEERLYNWERVHVTFEPTLTPHLYTDDESPSGEVRHPQLRLASRKFGSVEKALRSKRTISGTEHDMYAVRFTYTIEKEFPLFDELVATKHVWEAFPLGIGDLADFGKTYHGEAIATLNLFGEWEFWSMQLSDEGSTWGK